MVRLALVFALSCSVVSASDLTMSLKERVFQEDMESRFVLDGQALCKMILPASDGGDVTYNMPDNAYMTGIYLGTLAMKYAVTKDAETLQSTQRAMRALHLLCTVSGKPGLLARAAWPKERPLMDPQRWRDSPDGVHKWLGDVSCDQVDGVMFGASLAYALLANSEEKNTLSEDIHGIVDHILANNLCIVDVNGEPTQYGKYFPKIVRGPEKMNGLFWLQALKVAHQVTGDAKYDTLYHQYALGEGYAALSVQARHIADPNTGWMVNHSDDVLLFMAWETLLRLETDPALRDMYTQGLRRMWEGNEQYPGVKPEANPIHAFLAAKYLGDDSGVQSAIETLALFPLDLKMNRSMIEKYAGTYGFQYDGSPKSPEPQPGRPVPIDRRLKAWSAWVQNCYPQGLHSREGCERGKDFRVEFNGHDYLLGYWFGRYHGHVPQD
jgi:hypothetical protein